MPQTEEAQQMITTGELGRRMDDLASTVKDAIKMLGAKIDKMPDWDDVNRVERGLRAELEAEVSARKVHDTASDKALQALEDANRWLVRTTAGAVIVALSSAPIAIFVAIATRPPAL